MSVHEDGLRQVKQALAQLNVPDPFSVERFRRSLECQRQRRLITKPFKLTHPRRDGWYESVNR